MITRRALWAGMATAVAGVSGVTGLATRPAGVLASGTEDRRRHDRRERRRNGRRHDRHDDHGGDRG